MIDFHNHIIPNVDDGPRDFIEVKEMLVRAKSQGISDVIVTPHINNPRFEASNVSDEDIISQFQKLVNFIDDQKLSIKIHLGAELFFIPNLIKLKNHPFATIGNGKYMLIEFHPSFIPLSFNQVLKELRANNITPIIAHPERYLQIQENFDVVQKLHKLGSVFQIDAGSILGTFGGKTKKTAVKFLSSGLVHFIGSDAHNSKNRNFCLEPAIELSKEYLGDDVEILIYDNTKRLLEGKKTISIEKKKYWFTRKEVRSSNKYSN